MNARTRDLREHGQVLAIFALALVTIVAMTGLVLDGGATFVQRRDMQNVADAAAMAAGYDYATTRSSASATAAAKATAAVNGYVEGVDGVVLNVTVTEYAAGTTIGVDLGKPHENAFSGIVGLSTWDVSTTATSITGPPNVAIGVAPIIFNRDAVWPEDSDDPVSRWFGEPAPGSEDIPQGSSEFNWTLYCTQNGTTCNGDSNNVDELVEGTNETGSVITIDDTAINPLNAGSHTTLYSAMASLVGECFAVGVVDDDGTFLGVAMFCLTGAVGGSQKGLEGYFTTDYEGVTGWQLRIDINSGPAPTTVGGYIVYLYE